MRLRSPSRPPDCCAESIVLDSLLIGIVTGAFGIAYMAYGRRQTKFVPMIAGLLLCAYPYFVDGWVWLCAIGAVLLAAPFVIDY
jgi:hypothetical protein